MNSCQIKQHTQDSFPLRRWPEQAEEAVATLTSGATTAICLPLPLTMPRDACRQQIRLALTELVCRAWNCPASSLRLPSQAGQPATITTGARHAALSFSHETGLALVAIAPRSAVGIDVLALKQQIDWPSLAGIYFSPALCAQIRQEKPGLRDILYAQSWVSLEARLKAAATPLAEYSHERDDRLAKISGETRPLSGLPDGYVGAIVCDSFKTTR